MIPLYYFDMNAEVILKVFHEEADIDDVIKTAYEPIERYFKTADSFLVFLNNYISSNPDCNITFRGVFKG